MNNNPQNKDLQKEVPERLFTPMNPVNLAERKAKKISALDLLRKLPKLGLCTNDPKFAWDK